VPRLKSDTLEQVRERIEAAALEEFIRNGYSATSTRKIARAAGLTAGALYSHYASKEALFASVVKSYQRRLVGDHASTLLRKALTKTDFPYDIERLARAIRDLVRTNRAYWLLWYIDIVEFDGKHFQSQVAPKALIGQPELQTRFDWLREERLLRVDPELAFVMVYMHLFNYYCVETLFGGKNHYGVPEKTAITALSDVFMNGMLRRPADDP